MTEILKRCTKCEIEKPATKKFYQIDRSKKDGLYPSCKACRKLYNDENREKRNADSSRYRAENRQKMRDLSRRWADKNKERKTKNVKRWREENKEHISAYNNKYKSENKESTREHFRRAYAQNKERFLHHARNRVARRRSAEGSHTAADIQKQYDAQKGKCYYCECEVGKKYHVDHVIPLSRGGSNGPENLVISCPRCNESKGSKLPSEWPQGGRLL